MDDREPAVLPLSPAFDARSLMCTAFDEPISLLTSPQVTPATPGFLPLTREVTPLHTSFRLGTGPLDFSLALQRLSSQLARDVEGAESPERRGVGAVGEARARAGPADPLAPPALVGADELWAALPKVSEESLGALGAGRARVPEDPGGAAPLQRAGLLEEPPWAQRTPLGDGRSGKHLAGKEDFCMTFMNTPECTPLHVGFLSAPTAEGQCFPYVSESVAPPFAGELPPVPKEELPSVGSAGHPLLCARPCKYARKPRGCKDGAACARCHLCTWRRLAEKQGMSEVGPKMVAD